MTIDAIRKKVGLVDVSTRDKYKEVRRVVRSLPSVESLEKDFGTFTEFKKAFGEGAERPWARQKWREWRRS